MHSVTTALRVGAIAAALSGVTTFLLWLLPRLSSITTGPETRAGIVTDPFHLVRLWVNFWHVLLAVAAYAAAAFVSSRRSPAFAWAGLAAFAAWALTEAIGVSINLWAVHLAWRPAYLAADPAVRVSLEAAILTAGGIWDGLFFVVLVTFTLGTLFLGLSISGTPGLSRLVAVLLLLAVPLTIIIILDSFFGARLSAWVSWLYPILQPISRVTMAVWLWREAGRYHQPTSLGLP